MLRFPLFVSVLCLALVSLGSCTVLPVSRAPAAESYAERPSPHGADPFPNWPVPPHEAERLILHSRHEVQKITGAGTGTTGAEKVALSFPDDGLVLNLKWKPMDPSWKPVTERLDGINNSPRKELAAWKIQRLLLEPEDYVAPFTTAYCVPLAEASEEHRKQGPTLDGSQCHRLQRTQPSMILSLQGLGAKLLAMALTGERIEVGMLGKVLQVHGTETEPEKPQKKKPSQ